jgi:hypothetical protein
MGMSFVEPWCNYCLISYIEKQIIVDNFRQVFKLEWFCLQLNTILTYTSTRPEESYRVSCMYDHRNPEKGPYVSSWERKENEWMNLYNAISYIQLYILISYTI